MSPLHLFRQARALSLVLCLIVLATATAACVSSPTTPTARAETRVEGMASSGTPSPTTPSTATATPSPSPSATVTATPTSTATPTATATLAPQPVEAPAYITRSNAGQLQRRASIPAGPLGMLSAGFAFSPDSRFLAVDGGQEAWVWDIATGQWARQLTPNGAEKFTTGGSMVFSPDGRSIARVYDLTHVVVWDFETGEVIQTLQAGPDTQALFHLAFPTANRIVASAGTSSGTGLIAWDVARGEVVAESPSGSFRADSFAVSPNGMLVLQAGIDGTLRFWDPHTGALRGQQIIYACQDTLTGAAFSPNGWMLILHCESEGSRLFQYQPHYYRLGDMTLLNAQESPARGTGQISFNRDGAILAMVTGRPASEVQLWDMSRETTLHTLGPFASDIRQVSFSPDGRLLAIRLGDGTIELWGIP